MDEMLSKVINIKSEVLCRSAEDDFFYFSRINLAYKKLKEAVKLTPNHLKSLILLADISFIKGYIKKALDIYLKAEKINPSNVLIIAAIANCYFVLYDYKNSLYYCDKAISMFNNQYYQLFSQVYEIKISILTELKQYTKAYEIYNEAKNIFNDDYFKSISSVNYKILDEKIKLQKKLQKSNLKIV